jgi:hypothetical protein
MFIGSQVFILIVGPRDIITATIVHITIGIILFELFRKNQEASNIGQNKKAQAIEMPLRKSINGVVSNITITDIRLIKKAHVK